MSVVTIFLLVTVGCRIFLLLISVQCHIKAGFVPDNPKPLLRYSDVRALQQKTSYSKEDKNYEKKISYFVDIKSLLVSCLSLAFYFYFLPNVVYVLAWDLFFFTSWWQISCTLLIIPWLIDWYWYQITIYTVYFPAQNKSHFCRLPLFVIWMSQKAVGLKFLHWFLSYWNKKFKLK